MLSLVFCAAYLSAASLQLTGPSRTRVHFAGPVYERRTSGSWDFDALFLAFLLRGLFEENLIGDGDQTLSSFLLHACKKSHQPCCSVRAAFEGARSEKQGGNCTASIAQSSLLFFSFSLSFD